MEDRWLKLAHSYELRETAEPVHRRSAAQHVSAERRSRAPEKSPMSIAAIRSAFAAAAPAGSGSRTRGPRGVKNFEQLQMDTSSRRNDQG